MHLNHVIELVLTGMGEQWHTMITSSGENSAYDGTQLVLSALLSQVYATFSKVTASESRAKSCHEITR